MSSRRTTLLLLSSSLVFLAGLVACADSATSPRAGNAEDVAVNNSTVNGASDALLVARALALGMRDAAARIAVRDAMRASPLTEHKLVLGTFVQTPPGRVLIAAAAREAGTTVAALDSLIRGLPEADFYMPVRARRRSWQANGSMLVGAAFSSDLSTLTAYTPAGAEVRVPNGSAGANAPLLLIQPAERKSRRIAAQAPTAGNVIEDQNDGWLSGTIVQYLQNGDSTVTELADILVPSMNGGVRLLLECDPQAINCEEGGGGGGAPADTTFLQDVVIIAVCDYFDCNQGNEFVWHTYFSTDGGATFGNRTDVRFEGVPSTVEATWHVPVIFKEPHTLNDVIQTDVVETDIGGSDDAFLPSPRWNSTEKNVIKSHGDLRCGPPPYPRPPQLGGYYTCGQLIWREIQQSLRW